MRRSCTADGHGREEQKDNLLAIIFARNAKQIEHTVTRHGAGKPVSGQHTQRQNASLVTALQNKPPQHF